MANQDLTPIGVEAQSALVSVIIGGDEYSLSPKCAIALARILNLAAEQATLLATGAEQLGPRFHTVPR